MKLLITGHKGFIGTVIHDYLKGRGYNLTGIDAGDELPDEKFDYIVHMGARTLIRLSKDKPYEYFRDNMDLSMKVLELARKYDSTVLYPTSGSVSEATNPYSLAKKQVVEWIELYHSLYGTKRHILKFYNIYGPSSRKGAVFLFCNAALKNEQVTIYGDGSHIRDFIHVDDVVRGIEDIVNGKIPEGSHEIGTGRGTSVKELLEKVEIATGKNIQVKYEDYILPEGERLVASNPMIENTKKIEQGIEEVLEELNKEISGTL